jgi:peptidoglycan/xylan/chitin deacetylase (PgdA/CDA1 family)
MVTATAIHRPRSSASDAGFVERLLAKLSGGFVMALHEIAPERLAKLVDGMGPRQLISLSELVRRRKDGKSNSGLFAITVDDGVGVNVRGLTKLFQARAWPATFYLPTRYLDSGEAMAFQLWWSIKPLLPRRKLELNSGTVDFSRPGVFEEFAAKLERSWYCRRDDEYAPVTLELARIVAREEGAGLEVPAPISWNEVEQLSRDPLFQFESHGVSHVAMSALTADEIDAEMRCSRRSIEEHTGKPCRHLCYPFGSPESIGRVAPQIARRYYDSAVTMSLNSADRGDLWLMGRIPVYPDNSIARARMKVLLRCAVWPDLHWRRGNAAEEAC